MTFLLGESEPDKIDSMKSCMARAMRRFNSDVRRSEHRHCGREREREMKANRGRCELYDVHAGHIDHWPRRREDCGRIRGEGREGEELFQAIGSFWAKCEAKCSERQTGAKH